MEQQNSKSRKRLLLRCVPTTNQRRRPRVRLAWKAFRKPARPLSLELPAHMEMYFADKPTCDWQVEGNLPLICFSSGASWRNGPFFSHQAAPGAREIRRLKRLQRAGMVFRIFPESRRAERAFHRSAQTPPSRELLALATHAWDERGLGGGGEDSQLLASRCQGRGHTRFCRRSVYDFDRERRCAVYEAIRQFIKLEKFLDTLWRIGLK